MKILLVAGARPNFMKIAPIIRAIESKNDSNLKYKLVHTKLSLNLIETLETAKGKKERKRYLTQRRKGAKIKR